jgi:hypothetical protein
VQRDLSADGSCRRQRKVAGALPGRKTLMAEYVNRRVTPAPVGKWCW